MHDNDLASETSLSNGQSSDLAAVEKAWPGLKKFLGKYREISKIPDTAPDGKPLQEQRRALAKFYPEHFKNGRSGLWVADPALDDQSIPPVDGLYIGGGFPEMFLDELSANRGMTDHIRAAFNAGIPIWAECGGFMYLCREILDWEGQSWQAAGIIPARVKMTRRLQALGYIEATAIGDSIIARQGDVLRGHEFHYSIEENLDPANYAFSIEGGIRSAPGYDGYNKDNVLASYVHLHLRSNKTAAVNFLKACRQHRK